MIDPALALPLVLGIFGACVGSFLNVVIYRLPQDDLSVAKPARSFCPRCRKAIAWFDNIPVLSWLLLGGRCRGCKGEIAVRYLFVEVLTAFLFAAWAHLFRSRGLAAGVPAWEAWLPLPLGLLLIAIAIVVTYIDADLRIIPDEITLPGMPIGLVLSIVAPSLQRESWTMRALLDSFALERHVAAGLSSLAGLVVGGGALWLVGLAGKAAFRPKEGGEATDAMGFGDVKLMAGVGALLGADGALLVFFVGCVSGSLGGVASFLLGLPEVIGDVGRHARRNGGRTKLRAGAIAKLGWRRRRFIPFGPFLSLGFLVVFAWRQPIVDFLLHRWPELVRGWVGMR